MSKKLVFFTNILSHYQLSLSREFIRIYGSDYCFIATEPFPQEMLGYGVPDLNQESFVLRAYESQKAHAEAMALAEESDCLIFCGIPADIEMTARRAQKGKITFEYSNYLRVLRKIVQELWAETNTLDSCSQILTAKKACPQAQVERNFSPPPQ